MTLRSTYSSHSMGDLCGLFGKSRQAFYKWTPSEFAESAMEEIVIEEVRRIRDTAPGIGSRTLWLMLVGIFGAENMLGRDRFYALLREHCLQLKKRRTYRTTNSMHRFHKWKNLIKDFTPTAPNQLWVSDITYIKLARGVTYLHLVTDAYSRKIVGWKLSDSLEARHTLDAFDMAAAATANQGADLRQLIHHSDRGIQYCCNMYVQRLQDLGVRISMTEDYKPTDNAKAERVNGILKQLFLNDRQFSELSEVFFALQRGIAFYNDVRPHSSLSYKTPSAVHSGLFTEPRQMWTSRSRGQVDHGGMVTAL